MEPGGSNLKRKQSKRATLDSLLHPGIWRGNKKARSTSRSRSPSASGASTPDDIGANAPTQSNRSSQSPAGQPPQSQEYNRPDTSSPSTLSSYTMTRVPASTTVNATTPTQNSAGTTFSGLEAALRKLHIAADICPPFRSAVEGLTSCLHIFEEAANHRQEYRNLTDGLKSLVEQLIRHLHAAPSENIMGAISPISEIIRKEIESITIRQSQRGLRRVLGASGDDDDLLRRYRRIEQLFRQIQGEASMSTWNITSKHFINTQLDSLHPAKLARFDSSLSTEVSRRTCTENTRTKILQESMIWSENPNAAKVYWMNGMAGTGKTTIAYSICEALDARKQLAASFFCTRTSPECREAKRMVPTIAYQFARHSAPFRSALCKALENDPDISSRNITSQFDRLLNRPLAEIKDKLPDNLVVVIDGLDECSDPHIVELFLGHLFRSITGFPIKFYVTSRPEPIIRNQMMSESERSRSILYLHEIEKSLVQADIELYLKEELEFMSPADSDIRKLAEHAGNLFVYAATAIRYIRPTGKAVDSRTRLSTILVVNSGPQQKLSGIDALYSAILTTAIYDDGLEPEERERIRLMLWTAICACEPTRISTLSALCGINNKHTTTTALEPLQSVLHISDHSELVTTLHASFPDFMLTEQRSGVFFCDKVAHNQFLAQQCFEIMRSQLQFNICSIKSPFIPDDETPELQERITANISEELFYSGRFWVDHLSQADPVDILLPLVHSFLSQQLLFWMEVLNLKKSITTGAMVLSKLNSWLARPHSDTSPNLVELASGSSRLLIRYISSPISAYTPHIYLSALPLSPPSNAVCLCHLPRYKGLVKVSGTLLEKLEGSALCTWKSNLTIYSAALWPDGDIIVLGNWSGEISMHNIYNGKCLVQPYKAHELQVMCLGVSRNGTQVVSGSQDILRVWSMQDGSPISGPFKGHTDVVASVSFSPDGAQIVSGSWDNTIGIWNAHDATIPMRSLRGHTGFVYSVALSPDGTRIVSGSSDRTVRLWDLSTGTIIFISQPHRGGVISVQFSPDGAHVISGSRDPDPSICISNVSDGSLYGQPIKSDAVSLIAISPEGHIASAHVDGAVHIWNKYASEIIAGPFLGHAYAARYVGFSGDGMCVVSASIDNTVRVWNAHGRVAQVERPSKQTTKISYAPNFTISHNQTQLATFEKTHSHSSIDVWDLQSLALVTSISVGPNTEFVRFSVDGTCIISVHNPCDICVWDIRTAELVDGPHICFTRGDLQLIGCSVDATRVVAWDGKSDKFELWDGQSHQPIAHCEAGIENPGYSPRGPAFQVIFSLYGRRFATQCSCEQYPYNGNHIQVWDADSGLRIAGPFVKKMLLDISLDGTTILCLEEETSFNDLDRVQLINVDNGGTTLIPGTSDGSEWSEAKFSPDGLYVSDKLAWLKELDEAWNMLELTEDIISGIYVIVNDRFEELFDSSGSNIYFATLPLDSRYLGSKAFRRKNANPLLVKIHLPARAQAAAIADTPHNPLSLHDTSDSDLRNSIPAYEHIGNFLGSILVHEINSGRAPEILDHFEDARGIFTKFRSQFMSYVRQVGPFDRYIHIATPQEYWTKLSRHNEASIIAYLALKLFPNSMTEKQTVSNFTKMNSPDHHAKQKLATIVYDTDQAAQINKDEPAP
ncbi:hypothetical protein FRC11_003186, partial [Ceratobasidium sp. 423]